MKRQLILLILIISALAVTKANAYDKEVVHSQINYSALTESVVDRYLKEYLGINDGIELPLKKNSVNKRIEEWIIEGATQEDFPDC